MNHLGQGPIVRPLAHTGGWSIVRLAKLQFGLASKGSTSKGFARIHPNRCPTHPESCSILKEFHNAGGGSQGRAESGSHVQRTPKYNKPLRRVKKNLGWTINLPNTRPKALASFYLRAVSRADRRDL